MRIWYGRREGESHRKEETKKERKDSQSCCSLEGGERHTLKDFLRPLSMCWGSISKVKWADEVAGEAVGSELLRWPADDTLVSEALSLRSLVEELRVETFIKIFLLMDGEEENVEQSVDRLFLLLQETYLERLMTISVNILLQWGRWIREKQLN